MNKSLTLLYLAVTVVTLQSARSQTTNAPQTITVDVFSDFSWEKQLQIKYDNPSWAIYNQNRHSLDDGSSFSRLMMGPRLQLSPQLKLTAVFGPHLSWPNAIVEKLILQTTLSYEGTIALTMYNEIDYAPNARPAKQLLTKHVQKLHLPQLPAWINFHTEELQTGGLMVASMVGLEARIAWFTIWPYYDFKRRVPDTRISFNYGVNL